MKKVYTAKITHVMSDGTVLDSVEGIVVPVNNQTLPVYKTLADIAKRQMKNKTAS